MTYGDTIRGLTDEQLGDFLVEFLDSFVTSLEPELFDDLPEDPEARYYMIQIILREAIMYLADDIFDIVEEEFSG